MASGRPFKKGEPPPVGRPFPKGKQDWRMKLGSLKAGRTPDAFKEMCRSLASRDETLVAVMRILEDPSHQHYFSALRWASENGYGKPAQPITGEGGEGAVKHEVTIVRRIVDPTEPTP